MAVKLFGKTIVGGEAKRKEAAANEMSGKYPLTNDCDLMKSTIEAAKAELAQINASRPSTPGGRRIKSRQLDALRSWINEMQNFLKDLTCGIVYTPQGIVMTPVAATPPSTPGSVISKISGVEPTTPIMSPAPSPIIYTKEVVEEYVQPSIKCADGTFDVANGVNPPCATKGGVYMPSLPAPAPAPTLPSGQSTVVSSPLPTTVLNQGPGVFKGPTPVAASTDYAALYDTAALGTQIAQTQAQPQPAQVQDNTQKYLMYGGIALVGVLVLNSLLNRE